MKRMKTVNCSAEASFQKEAESVLKALKDAQDALESISDETAEALEIDDTYREIIDSVYFISHELGLGQ